MPARACDVMLLFCGIVLVFVRPPCKSICRVDITEQANNKTPLRPVGQQQHMNFQGIYSICTWGWSRLNGRNDLNCLLEGLSSLQCPVWKFLLKGCTSHSYDKSWRKNIPCLPKIQPIPKSWWPSPEALTEAWDAKRLDQQSVMIINVNFDNRKKYLYELYKLLTSL